jgi:outer membrane protein W
MCTKILTKIIVMTGLLFFTIMPFASQAQQGQLQLDVNYAIGIPSSTFKTDVVNKTSFRGWTGNLMYNITRNFSVGVGVGYQDFYQKYDRQVYKLAEGGEVSAVLTNSIQTVPALVEVQYKFLPGSIIQPYIGVGGGANFITYDQYLGEFDNSTSDVKFAVRPEVGFFIPFTKSGAAGIHAFGAYNYLPYKVNGIDNLSNWGAGLGVKFSLK